MNKKSSLRQLDRLIAKHEKMLKDKNLKPFIFFVTGIGGIKLYAKNEIEAKKILIKCL